MNSTKVIAPLHNTATAGSSKQETSGIDSTSDISTSTATTSTSANSNTPSTNMSRGSSTTGDSQEAQTLDKSVVYTMKRSLSSLEITLSRGITKTPPWLHALHSQLKECVALVSVMLAVATAAVVWFACSLTEGPATSFPTGGWRSGSAP
ncbi:hypothetical protein PtrSN002B_011741, partial [Pyrenophora tritici-repentis]